MAQHPDQPAPAAPAPGQDGPLRLNHLNLCTSAVPTLSRLFTQHFDFTLQQGDETHALLHGRDGFFLVLTLLDAHAPAAYPYSVAFGRHISFHVGFMLAAPAQVHAKHAELLAGGWQPEPVQAFEALGAAWTAFYCPLGDGIALEVNAHVALPGAVVPG